MLDIYSNRNIIEILVEAVRLLSLYHTPQSLLPVVAFCIMPNFTNKKERNEWYQEYRKKNIEKLRKYKRLYNKKWRLLFGYHNEINSKKRYPEKAKAQHLLQRAVKIGKIKRGNCRDCNQPNAQGHHPDYSKPLEVVWLCPVHHSREHQIIIS